MLNILKQKQKQKQNIFHNSMKINEQNNKIQNIFDINIFNNIIYYTYSSKE